MDNDEGESSLRLSGVKKGRAFADPWRKRVAEGLLIQLRARFF